MRVNKLILFLHVKVTKLNCSASDYRDRFRLIMCLCPLFSVFRNNLQDLLAASMRRGLRPFTFRLHRPVRARTSFLRSSHCRSRFSYIYLFCIYIFPRVDPLEI